MSGKVLTDQTSINLIGNNITDSGVRELVRILESNYTLTNIILDGHKKSPELLQQITALLARNKQELQKTKEIEEQKQPPTQNEPILKLPLSSQIQSVNQLVKQISQTPELKGSERGEASETITVEDIERMESEAISTLKKRQTSQGRDLESLTQTLKKEEANFNSQEESIRKEITTELEKLTATNVTLQAELSKSQSKSALEIEQIKFQIANNTSQISTLRTNQEMLLAAHQKQQQITEEKNQIISNPLTFIFYNTVLKNLEATLLSYRLTSQGIVERKTAGGLATITKAIGFIGDSIPLPGASFVAKVIMLAVKNTESAVHQKKEQAIDDLTNSISQIQDLAERTARALTLRYDEQLGNLTTASSAELAKTAVENIIREIYTKQNERIVIESLINSLREQGSDLAASASGNSGITTAILTQILESDQIGKAKNKLIDYLAKKFRKLNPQEKGMIIEGIVGRAKKLNLNRNQQSGHNSEINQMDQMIENIADDLVSIVLEDHQDNIMDYLDNPTKMLAEKAKQMGSKAMNYLKEKGAEAKTKAEAEDNQPSIATNHKITAKWTAKGIFQEAGIQTKEGEYYSAPTRAITNPMGHTSNIASKPQIYGYRIGTKEEVQKLHLSIDQQRIRSEVVEVSLSKATNQQVRNLGEDARRVGEEAELLRRQLQQNKDQQAQEAEKMKKRIEKLEERLVVQQQSHQRRDSGEFDEEALKDAIKTSFSDKIKELNLEDKLGSAADWQIIKHTGKDAFKLVLNVANISSTQRVIVKNELSSRNIDTKNDIINKTVFIENIDANNLDELLAKLEAPNLAPSPSPSAAKASMAGKQSDSIANDL